jgi:two-component system LytT family sensor kinase
MLIRKLSSILRKLLQDPPHFIPLKEELEFIDSYLDIEAVRFGSGKLMVNKEVDEAALESYVPSMIIQPLVENAVKHGVGSRLEGGRIVIRARRGLGSAIIEIEDNGVGFPVSDQPGSGLGIGLSNVNERLNVIYGPQCQLQLESTPGRGTIARVVIPDVDVSYLRAS